MKLIWYGTASLLLQAENTTIAFDPFCGMPEGGFMTRHRAAKTSGQTSGSRKVARRPIHAYRQATDIFVTHGHFDHIYHIPAIYRNLPVTVYCTKTPRRTLLKHGFPKQRYVSQAHTFAAPEFPAAQKIRRITPFLQRWTLVQKSPENSPRRGHPETFLQEQTSIQKIREIAPGWIGTVGPFTIRAYQGRHCRFDLPLLVNTVFCRRFWRHPLHLLHLLAADLTFPENGEILFYEVACQGQRIQIMGSMNLDADTEYPTGADVLILPLQGRSDQDTYALELVKRLKPKSILLDHYDDAFPPLTNDVDTSGFVRNVQAQLGIPCRPLEKYREIIIE